MSDCYFDFDQMMRKVLREKSLGNRKFFNWTLFPACVWGGKSAIYKVSVVRSTNHPTACKRW